MPLLIALRKGSAKCSSACPWYTETGKVHGFNGPLKTHCRMTMHPWMADCNMFDPCQIEKLEVSEEQWLEMQKVVNKKAQKQRKLYPEEHKEIHHVGESRNRSASSFPKNEQEDESYWEDKGKWNAQKSGEVINKHYNKKNI